MYYLQHTNVNIQSNHKNLSKKVYFLIYEENKKYFKIFTSVWHSLWSILCMYTKTMKFGQQEVKLWRLKDLRFNVKHIVCARYENKHSVNHMFAIIVCEMIQYVCDIKVEVSGTIVCTVRAAPAVAQMQIVRYKLQPHLHQLFAETIGAVSGLRGHSSQPPPPPPPLADFGITRPGPLAAS